jgi:hypothetical protein
MKKSNAYLPVLMAGLMAAAGAYAQSTPAAGSSDTPPKAGEASTQTMGAPNAKTTNSPVSEAPSPSTAAASTTYVAPAPVAQTTTHVTTTTAMGAGPGARARKSSRNCCHAARCSRPSARRSRARTARTTWRVERARGRSLIAVSPRDGGDGHRRAGRGPFRHRRSSSVPASSRRRRSSSLRHACPSARGAVRAARACDRCARAW